MKKSEELKQLYEDELKPQLATMEDMRKYIKRWRNMAIAAAVIAYAGFKFVQYWGNLAIGGIFLVAAIYCTIKALISYTKYRAEFKEEVVRKVVQLINPDYLYHPTSHIDSFTFKKAGIFPFDFDRCTGDDMITGNIEKVPFKFSELKIEQKKETRDSDGNRTTEWSTLFRGIFFYAEFNKDIENSTFILPQNDKKVTNLLGKEKSKSRNYGELVKLENPVFEKIFSVYGSSQQEARYVITPVMMEAIVNLYNHYKLKMYFSFKGQSVYFAIPFNKNLFEPKIGKNGIQYEDIEEMYMLFGLIETIIKEMNLNTRIWTKEFKQTTI